MPIPEDSTPDDGRPKKRRPKKSAPGRFDKWLDTITTQFAPLWKADPDHAGPLREWCQIFKDKPWRSEPEWWELGHILEIIEA